MFIKRLIMFQVSKEQAFLELFLQKLLWEAEYHNTAGDTVKVMRLKGVLAISGRREKVILQGVHDTYDTYTTRPWGKGEEVETTVILIGRNMDLELLQKSFMEVLNS